VESPLDLSKKLQEMGSRKLESPLDLSRKTVMMHGDQDMKPVFRGSEMHHIMLTCVSSASEPKLQKNAQRTLAHHRFSSGVLTTGSSVPLTSALVQKVSPVQLQQTCAKQTARKTCVITAAPRTTVGHSGQVRSAHSVGRSVSDTKLPTASNEPKLGDGFYSTTLLSTHSVHAGPHYRSITPSVFDSDRKGRVWPVAQVNPSRVVTSASESTAPVIVPSQNSGESPRKVSGDTLLSGDSCQTACAMASSRSAEILPHSESASAFPVSTSNSSYSCAHTPVSVATLSIDVSPPMPILSPNGPTHSSQKHSSQRTVSPDQSPAMAYSSKGILPSAESSPDQGSMTDGYESGHELSSTHMEWSDNCFPVKTDSEKDLWHAEDSAVKQTAFEVVGICSRTLLDDVRRPCFAAMAFDRNLLSQSETVDCRDFISRTKYYKFHSRKTYGATGGAFDVDTALLDKCGSPSPSHELRLPVQLSSALKTSAAIRQIPCSGGGKSGFDDSLSKCDVAKEANNKFGSVAKKVRKQDNHQQDEVGKAVVGSTYSSLLRSSPPKVLRFSPPSRAAQSNSLAEVKSESTEALAVSDSKPRIHRRLVCRHRKKGNSPEMSASYFDSFDEIVGICNETNNRSVRSRDVTLSGRSVNCVSVGSEGSSSKSTFGVPFSIKTEAVGSSELHCPIEPKTEPDDDGDTYSLRKNTRRRTLRIQLAGSGDSLAASTSAKSETESEHSGDVCTKTSEISSIGSSQRLGRTLRGTGMKSRSSKPQENCSDRKPRQLRRSVVGSCSPLCSRSEKSVQSCILSETDQPIGGRVLRTEEHRDGNVRDSESNGKFNASDVQTKAQRSILKQLESSEGYIAEKNVKYSKTEDLFEDSSLLSREQRALRVSVCH